MTHVSTLRTEHPEAIRSHAAPNKAHRRKLVHGRAAQMTLAEAQWLIRAARCYGLSMSLVRFDPWAVYETCLHMEMVADAKESSKRVREHGVHPPPVPPAPLKVRWS